MNEVQVHEDTEDGETSLIRWNDGSITLTKKGVRDKALPEVFHLWPKQVDWIQSICTKRGFVTIGRKLDV